MDKDTYEKGYFRILRFISHKPRTEKEVSDKLDLILVQVQTPPEDLENFKENIIQDLKEKRYIGDVDYAEEFVRSAVNSKKLRSKSKIKQTLLKKGISREILSNAMELVPSEYEFESALKEAQKKLRLMVGKDTFMKKRKLMDYLYRKGYHSSVISSVVDTLMDLK